MRYNEAMTARTSRKFILAMAGAAGIGIALFVAGMFRNGTPDYWYLIYNLALALIPLLFSYSIVRLLIRYPWKSWRIIALSLVWVVFLPNSFYIVTDFIHLADGPRVDIVQDAVMLMQFSVLGLIAGFISLDMLHTRWAQVCGKTKAMSGAMVVLFLSSLAIYLGRELRWNSWDVVLHPLEVGRDVLVLWIDPLGFSGALWMIGSYFGMLATLYLVWWYGRKIKI